MEKEAQLIDTLPDGRVRCRVCEKRCLILPGETGHCTTRFNRDGRLYTLTYGLVASRHIAPAEIKPLFHFYPGSTFLSLGSLGCNFRCPGCQNWELAHYRLDTTAALREAERQNQYVSPEAAVKDALALGCRGISWTYNEPTLWLEYTLDTARLAREQGLATNYVTNGSLTEEALALIAPYLDAFRVDVKAFSPGAYWQAGRFADPAAVRRRVEAARHRFGMHVELVTNLMPDIYSWEEELRPLIRWIRDRVGPDTPWHITRFVPHGAYGRLPYTPLEIMEEARRTALDEGLRFVYLGNVPGHAGENTYCPRCSHLLIERMAHRVVKNRIKGGACPSCGEVIPGVGMG